MLRSIATVSLGGTLTEKLAAIAAAGFDGVEIFENDLLYFDGSPRDVKRIADDLGLRILLFQPFRDFEAAPRARQARAGLPPPPRRRRSRPARCCCIPASDRSRAAP